MNRTRSASTFFSTNCEIAVVAGRLFLEGGGVRDTWYLSMTFAHPHILNVTKRTSCFECSSFSLLSFDHLKR